MSKFIYANLWADSNEMEFETCSEFPTGYNPAYDIFKRMEPLTLENAGLGT